MSLHVSRRRLLLGTAAAAGLAAAGGLERTAPVLARPVAAPVIAPMPTNIRVAFWSQPIAEQANVFAAQEMGWFRQEGLDFEFMPGAGGADALKNILAGNADLAFTNLEPVFFALDQGSRLKAIYNIYPVNVFNVVAPKERGIARPADLKGKRIGVYSRASGTYHNLLVLLRSVGLRESDVEVVAAGVNNFGPLLQGAVDAQAATDTGLYLARQQGLGEVTEFWVRDYLNTPADAFVATEEALRDHRSLLLSFLRVYRRATQWTLEHPEEAAAIAQRYAVDGADPAVVLQVVKLRNASTVNADTDAHGLGWFNLDTLRRTEEALADLGLTTNRVDVSTVFTNELVEGL